VKRRMGKSRSTGTSPLTTCTIAMINWFEVCIVRLVAISKCTSKLSSNPYILHFTFGFKVMYLFWPRSTHQSIDFYTSCYMSCYVVFNHSSKTSKDVRCIFVGPNPNPYAIRVRRVIKIFSQKHLVHIHVTYTRRLHNYNPTRAAIQTG